ncbi:putative Aspartate--tRNA ligase [Blattamonas nauphoetae]|uniref:aspartate--tRNA ligase n=1 Tax=Blattamonas nauphoetae TaxID=2049346 RepID=A0ABQ9Y6C7_9EUKA|nr:putative Aspartate--tRNA ligase [Blattamonas nauphoetae]
MSEPEQPTTSANEVPCSSIQSLNKEFAGKPIKIRAFLHTKRDKKRWGFLVLRQTCYTIQGVVDTQKVTNFKDITIESVVEVFGTLSACPKPVTGCTQSDVEVSVDSITVISPAPSQLPIQVNQLDIVDQSEEGRAKTNPEMLTVQKYRTLDLRSKANWGIFRIQSGVGRLFREFMYQNDFTEIHTPKICPGKSEGGANCFELKYFEQDATLAQSPQLYKQMCIAGGFQRVFEVAPAFRAEKMNTPRHLCEFTSMDFEMELNSFEELPRFAYSLFVYMFTKLKEQYQPEIEAVRAQFPCQDLLLPEEPILIDFREGCEMLKAAGIEQNPKEDIGTQQERDLGRLVKEKYKTDIYCLVGFPTESRAFYTQPDPACPEYSLSFDVELRGEEIVSGAQRIIDPELLLAQMAKKDMVVNNAYVDAFRMGCPRHGGIGIGLERVTMFFLGLDTVKRAVLFPRTPAPMYF